MYYHDASLEIPVQVTAPNPRYAAMVLEQFGGANGELRACLQYFVQSFAARVPAVHDLLVEVSTEEMSHLEIVGTLVQQFMSESRDLATMDHRETLMAAEAEALRTAGATAQKLLVVGGGGPLLADSSGTPFTGAYVSATGELGPDLQADVSAELGAKRVYEMLHRTIPDRGAREALDFLIQREEAHAALFQEALEMIRDAGTLRDFHDTALSRAYPAVSRPATGNEVHFDVSRGVQPIKGPLAPDQVRVALVRLP